MNRQPTLTGPLVRLSPLRPIDFRVLYRAASDPLIWEQHPEPARYTSEVFQRYWKTIMNSGGALAIRDATGRIIGASTFYDFDGDRREVKIGYTFIEREFWRKGYNPEAKRLMLKHAFQFVDRVLFEVGASNTRSQVALGRLGAKPVAENSLPGLDGTPIRCVVFEINKNSHISSQ
jgi:N-acetyltransferase